MIYKAILTTSNPNLGFLRLSLRPFTRHVKKPKVKVERIPEAGPAIKPRQLWKPFTFTISVVGVSFTSAIIIEYERRRSHVRLLPESFHELRRKFKPIDEVYSMWQALNPCEKVFFGMCAFNLMVCLGLKIMPNQLFPYFVSHARAKLLFPSMFLHIFSHSSLLHLSINMYVLYSCLPMMNFYLGPEQSCALYLGAGMFASLASVVYRSIRGIPNPSLGASGAILGMIAASCMINPEGKVGIIFVPHLAIPAKYGVCGIIALDTLGLIRGWKYFDHAAHLGGTLFGVWYIKYGQDLIWKQRSRLLRQYLEIKKKF